MPSVDPAPDLSRSVPALDPGTAFSGPSGMLLQPDGPRLLADATTPRPTSVPSAPSPPAPPDVTLALDAERLVHLLGLHAGRPSRWSAPAFGREVDLVRAHLRPIRSREMLASSLGREAFHGQAAPGSDPALGGSAVRVAYAIRWLELGDGRGRVDWRALLDGSRAG